MAPLVVLSIVAILACASALAESRALARLRTRHAGVSARLARDAFVLETMYECIEAARDSSEAVIVRLCAAIRRCEPAVDAVLAFVPHGEDLAAAYAEGARVEHYRGMRVRRDGDRSLPARAAATGHRASSGEGTVIPTDRYALAVPMLDRGQLHGVLYCSSATAVTFVEEEAIVRAIEHAAPSLALAIEREGDRADATYDALTGLLTPRAFRDRLRAGVANLQARPRSVVSLWFIDTDHFKTVNDTYGHSAGDRVLQEMASLLRAHTVTDVDVVARNGGDEFCALIFEAQKTVAIERAQALCQAVRNRDFGIPVRMSASIGVASLPFDARDANELLEIADAAMYHSKRCGRDRVSFAVDATTFSVYR